MKQALAFALLALLWSTSDRVNIAYAEGLPVLKDFAADAKESTIKQAPIVLLFMSSTCTYCERVLREFLVPMHHDPEYADKVILRQIDVGSKTRLVNLNGKITSPRALTKFHNVMAVPTVVFFDGKGNELTRIVGLTNADFYLSYLENAISESQTKIKENINKFK